MVQPQSTRRQTSRPTGIRRGRLSRAYSGSRGRSCGARLDGRLETGQRASGTAERMDATAFRIGGCGRRAADQAAVRPRNVMPLALSLDYGRIRGQNPQPQRRELLQEAGFLYGERMLLRRDVGEPALDRIKECLGLGLGRHGDLSARDRRWADTRGGSLGRRTVRCGSDAAWARGQAIAHAFPAHVPPLPRR